MYKMPPCLVKKISMLWNIPPQIFYNKNINDYGYVEAVLDCI